MSVSEIDLRLSKCKFVTLKRLINFHSLRLQSVRVTLVLNRGVIHRPFYLQINSRRLPKRTTRVVFHFLLKNTCQAIAFLHLNPNCRQTVRPRTSVRSPVRSYCPALLNSDFGSFASQNSLISPLTFWPCPLKGLT